MKLTLLQFNEQLTPQKAPKNLADVKDVFWEGLGEDHDVVEVHEGEAI